MNKVKVLDRALERIDVVIIVGLFAVVSVIALLMVYFNDLVDEKTDLMTVVKVADQDQNTLVRFEESNRVFECEWTRGLDVCKVIKEGDRVQVTYGYTRADSDDDPLTVTDMVILNE